MKGRWRQDEERKSKRHNKIELGMEGARLRERGREKERERGRKE